MLVEFQVAFILIEELPSALAEEPKPSSLTYVCSASSWYTSRFDPWNSIHEALMNPPVMTGVVEMEGDGVLLRSGGRVKSDGSSVVSPKE